MISKQAAKKRKTGMSRLITAIRYGSGLAIFVAALTSIVVNTFFSQEVVEGTVLLASHNVEWTLASLTAIGGTTWKLIWVG